MYRYNKGATAKTRGSEKLSRKGIRLIIPV
jgi:hypothetical protein